MNLYYRYITAEEFDLMSEEEIDLWEQTKKKYELNQRVSQGFMNPYSTLQDKDKDIDKDLDNINKN